MQVQSILLLIEMANCCQVATNSSGDSKSCQLQNSV